MAGKMDELDQRIDGVMQLALENTRNLMGDQIKFLHDQIEFDRDMTRRDLALRERKMTLAERQADQWGKLVNTAADLIPVYIDVVKSMTKTPAFPPAIHSLGNLKTCASCGLPFFVAPGSTQDKCPMCLEKDTNDSAQDDATSPSSEHFDGNTVD